MYSLLLFKCILLTVVCQLEIKRVYVHTYRPHIISTWSFVETTEYVGSEDATAQLLTYRHWRPQVKQFADRPATVPAVLI